MCKEKTEWMEFDPENDPRVKEVKENHRMKDVQDGCLGSFMFGIFFFAVVVLLLMASG